jgi:hypothetical protein
MLRAGAVGERHLVRVDACLARIDEFKMAQPAANPIFQFARKQPSRMWPNPMSKSAPPGRQYRFKTEKKRVHVPTRHGECYGICTPISQRNASERGNVLVHQILLHSGISPEAGRAYYARRCVTYEKVSPQHMKKAPAQAVLFSTQLALPRNIVAYSHSAACTKIPKRSEIIIVHEPLAAHNILHTICAHRS